MVLNPLITILLPAYNAERFIKEAINSLLAQSYTQFELIIINDGSSDATQEIIEQYDDNRIICIHHHQNKGLIASLNEGIACAKGEFIIRMDADDIAFEHRIKKQVAYLLENPSIAIVSAHAVFFENNIQTPLKNWNLDLKTIDPKEIKQAMAWENCIIHPCVCMRTEVARQLGYDPYQKNYEDYDLWLRALAHHYKIAKIAEPLLYYRVQENSITQNSIRKGNFFFQKTKVKFHFVKTSIANARFNGFVGKVLLTIFVDLLKGVGKALKNK